MSFSKSTNFLFASSVKFGKDVAHFIYMIEWKSKMIYVNNE